LNLFSFSLVFGLALVLALAVTPLAGVLGRRLGLVDRPGPRRVHPGIVPRTGGIALYIAFTASVLATLIFPAGWFPSRLDPNEGTRLTALLLGSTFAFAAGLVDDRRELPPGPQFASQFIASLIAMGGLIFIQIVNNPFTNQPLRLPWLIVYGVTVFWFAGMMNTVNWLDGLDGLAAGVGAILCAILAAHMIREGQYSVALLPLALLGATLGFLPFNFHPSRIIMGSSGSYFLGFALAALGIIAGARVATVLLVMGLPIMDVAWRIWSRWRRQKPVGLAGRDHLHHRLLALGFSQRRIVLGYYLFCAAFGLLALVLSSRLYKLLLLVALAAVALALLWWVEKRTDG
jgi:UDP-GlcNAc:undecaprenyl-phosphate GlcNAc-1-phosphate transferase